MIARRWNLCLTPDCRHRVPVCPEAGGPAL